MYGFIVIPALFVILFHKIHRYIFIVIYAVSFLTNIDSLYIVNAASNVSVAENKLKYYYKVDNSGEGVDPIALRKEKSDDNFYKKYGKTSAVYLGATIFCIFILISGYYNKDFMSDVEFGLMSTALTLLALANFLSFAYTLYSRTMANASLYILVVMVLLSLRKSFIISKRNKLFGAVFFIGGVVVFIPKVIYFLSIFLIQTNVFMLAFPYLRYIEGEKITSLRDLLDFFI